MLERLYTVLQCRTGKGLALLPLLAFVEELPGILMDPPQHIDHQCGSDPALQESFVVVQSIPDLYYTQKVGAFIAKQHLDKPDIVC
jgi:hypothetical protein